MDEEEEEDSFVVDDEEEGAGDYRFFMDKFKKQNIRYNHDLGDLSDEVMETRWDQIEREEIKSKKLAALEDKKEYQMELERKKKKMELKKK